MQGYYLLYLKKKRGGDEGTYGGDNDNVDVDDGALTSGTTWTEEWTTASWWREEAKYKNEEEEH